MSRKLTTLDRPLIRRIGGSRLIVRISPRGLEIRGYRRRRWRLFTWEQIATLAPESQPVTRQAERAEGRRLLARLGAN